MLHFIEGRGDLAGKRSDKALPKTAQTRYFCTWGVLTGTQKLSDQAVPPNIMGGFTAVYDKRLLPQDP